MLETLDNDDRDTRADADEDKELAYSQHILEKLRMFQTYRIGPDYFASADFDIEFNLVRLAFEKDLLSDRLAEDQYTGYHTVSTPKTTWQMFKATNERKWWLSWLVKRKPVQYHDQELAVTVNVGRYLTYPEAVIQNTRLGRAVIFEQLTEVRD